MNFKVITESTLLDEISRWNLKYWLNLDSSKSINTKYPLIPLGKLVMENKKSLSPKDFPEMLFNYIGLENIKSFSGILTGFKPKYGKEIKSRSKIFIEGDILYGRLRPSLNKCILIDNRLKEGVCSTEFFVLKRSSDKILPNYLRFILTSDIILEKVKILTAGAALPRIQIKDFLKLEIPLPPIEIQNELESFLEKSHAEHLKLFNTLNEFPEKLNQSIRDSLVLGTKPVLEKNQNNQIKNWNNPLPVKKTLKLF